VSLLFDISDLFSFANDNHKIRWNASLVDFKEDMKISLNQIIKWLKGSGLKGNQSKNEKCIFHRNSCQLTCNEVDSVLVKTSDSINVLGVEVYFILQWSIYINQ
jgi:hypothetical protein